MEKCDAENCVCTFVSGEILLSMMGDYMWDCVRCVKMFQSEEVRTKLWRRQQSARAQILRRFSMETGYCIGEFGEELFCAKVCGTISRGGGVFRVEVRNRYIEVCAEWGRERGDGKTGNMKCNYKCNHKSKGVIKYISFTLFVWDLLTTFINILGQECALNYAFLV